MSIDFPCQVAEYMINDISSCGGNWYNLKNKIKIYQAKIDVKNWYYSAISIVRGSSLSTINTYVQNISLSLYKRETNQSIWNWLYY